MILHDLVNPATLVGGLAYAFVFLLIAWLVNRWIRRAIDGVLRRDHDERIDRTAIHFVRKLTHIAVYILAFLLFAHLVPAIRYGNVA